ncbi:hypothetical protein A2U01_0060430, partial [Trifolium medium]|nr:hypothetical protein [Trifolium medium]
LLTLNERLLGGTVESGSTKDWLWKLRVAQGHVARRAVENSKGRNVTDSCVLCRTCDAARRHGFCED